MLIFEDVIGMETNNMLNQNNFYDVKRMPENGTFVMPLSIPKLHGEQSPEAVYQFLHFLNKKMPRISADVIFLYTNGLYFNNTDESALSLRIRTSNQITVHKQALKSMIDERYEFTPQAFHFLPWDYIILNSHNFSDFMYKLENRFETDAEFRQYVIYDTGGREPSKANIRFILEELVVVYLINQKLVPLPSSLAEPNRWRLLTYSGPAMLSCIYLYQKKILPIKIIDERFSRCHYDTKAKVLIDFDTYNLALHELKSPLCA